MSNFTKRNINSWLVFDLNPPPHTKKNSITILLLDNKIIDDVAYNGFPLRNFDGREGWYSRVTVEECQYLCEISDLCRYFNYEVKMEYMQYENLCELKFGGTKREALVGTGLFGHKYSQG